MKIGIYKERVTIFGILRGGEVGDVVGTINHLLGGHVGTSWYALVHVGTHWYNKPFTQGNFPSTLERRWVLMSALIKCLVQWEML